MVSLPHSFRNQTSLRKRHAGFVAILVLVGFEKDLNSEGGCRQLLLELGLV